MRQDADDALPGLLLFLAQRAAQIGEDEQLVRLAVAAERRAAQLEPAAFRPERPLDESRRVAGEVVGQVQLLGAASKKDALWLPDEALGGRVHQHEMRVHVEGEHGHVDGAHDALQELCRFDGLGALPLQRVAERVDLLHHHVGGTARLRAGAADGVVPFAQRPEQVGLQVQRAGDHLKGDRCRADPDGADDRDHRPAHLEAVWLRPGDVHERQGGWQAAHEGEQQHRALEAAVQSPGPNRLRRRSPSPEPRTPSPEPRSPSPDSFTHGRHIAAGGGKARSGSYRAAAPPGARRRRGRRGPSR